jgi:hypothetical protein
MAVISAPSAVACVTGGGADDMLNARAGAGGQGVDKPAA